MYKFLSQIKHKDYDFQFIDGAVELHELHNHSVKPADSIKQIHEQPFPVLPATQSYSAKKHLGNNKQHKGQKIECYNLQ